MYVFIFVVLINKDNLICYCKLQLIFDVFGKRIGFYLIGYFEKLENEGVILDLNFVYLFIWYIFKCVFGYKYFLGKLVVFFNSVDS